MSPRRRPGINNKTPSLSFFSSAQAQGSPKDPRARLLPSSPEPFEMVWNPGSSQSATSSSQLPGGSAAGCGHGQPSEPHHLGSKPAPGTPGETQAARTQGPDLSPQKQGSGNSYSSMWLPYQPFLLHRLPATPTSSCSLILLWSACFQLC